MVLPRFFCRARFTTCLLVTLHAVPCRGSGWIMPDCRFWLLTGNTCTPTPYLPYCLHTLPWLPGFLTLGSGARFLPMPATFPWSMDPSAPLYLACTYLPRTMPCLAVAYHACLPGLPALCSSAPFQLLPACLCLDCGLDSCQCLPRLFLGWFCACGLLPRTPCALLPDAPPAAFFTVWVGGIHGLPYPDAVLVRPGFNAHFLGLRLCWFFTLPRFVAL